MILLWWQWRHHLCVSAGFPGNGLNERRWMKTSQKLKQRRDFSVIQQCDNPLYCRASASIRQMFDSSAVTQQTPNKQQKTQVSVWQKGTHHHQERERERGRGTARRCGWFINQTGNIRWVDPLEKIWCFKLQQFLYQLKLCYSSCFLVFVSFFFERTSYLSKRLVEKYVP